jgi:hypothetical protein
MIHCVVWARKEGGRAGRPARAEDGAGSTRQRACGHSGSRGPRDGASAKSCSLTPSRHPSLSKQNKRTQIVSKAADLMDAISEGATSFLITEYKYMGVFMVRR